MCLFYTQYLQWFLSGGKWLVTKLKAKPLHYCPISFAGKIGYGTVSESLACKKPLVFVRRDHFNEEPFLRKMLEVHPTLRRLPLNLLLFTLCYSLLKDGMCQLGVFAVLPWRC